VELFPSEVHLAVVEQDPRLLATLVSAGHNINASDSANQTALHYAAQRGEIECLKILIASGATIDARDDLRQTPLYLATGAARNAAEMIMELRGAGADPFARTAAGSTPYDLAHLWDDEIAACYSDLPMEREDGQSPQEVPNVVCFATRSLVDAVRRVGTMHRDAEGTWFFATGAESQSDLDRAENSAIYSLQTIASMDPLVIRYLRSEPSTTLVRRSDGEFVPP